MPSTNQYCGRPIFLTQPATCVFRPTPSSFSRPLFNRHTNKKRSDLNFLKQFFLLFDHNVQIKANQHQLSINHALLRHVFPFLDFDDRVVKHGKFCQLSGWSRSKASPVWKTFRFSFNASLFCVPAPK